MTEPINSSTEVQKKLCLACNRQYQDASLSHCPVDSTQLVNLGRDERRALCGKVIAGKYKIIDLVGKGALGSVYKAELLDGKGTVALKLMPADDPSGITRKRFEQIARSWGELKHTNLISPLDFGVIDNKYAYLVLEFVEGESLNSMIQQGPLSPQRCLQIFSQAMSALGAAHEKAVLHREIKPTKIIVVQSKVDGEETTIVKIDDFGGLAAVQRSSLRQDQPVDLMMLPSPLYMSPEACQGKKLGVESDIYSLAVTLYEALTGKLPFHGRHTVEVASMHISSAPPPFGLIRPELRLSNKLQKVVFKALNKNPAERFQSMNEFQVALYDAIEGADSNGGYLCEGESPDIPPESVSPARKAPDPIKRPQETDLSIREQLLIGFLAVVLLLCFNYNHLVTNFISQASRSQPRTVSVTGQGAAGGTPSESAAGEGVTGGTASLFAADQGAAGGKASVSDQGAAGGTASASATDKVTAMATSVSKEDSFSKLGASLTETPANMKMLQRGTVYFVAVEPSSGNEVNSLRPVTRYRLRQATLSAQVRRSNQISMDLSCPPNPVLDLGDICEFFGDDFVVARVKVVGADNSIKSARDVVVKFVELVANNRWHDAASLCANETALRPGDLEETWKGMKLLDSTASKSLSAPHFRLNAMKIVYVSPTKIDLILNESAVFDNQNAIDRFSLVLGRDWKISAIEKRVSRAIWHDS